MLLCTAITFLKREFVNDRLGDYRLGGDGYGMSWEQYCRSLLSDELFEEMRNAGATYGQGGEAESEDPTAKLDDVSDVKFWSVFFPNGGTTRCTPRVCHRRTYTTAA